MNECGFKLGLTGYINWSLLRWFGHVESMDNTVGRLKKASLNGVNETLK